MINFGNVPAGITLYIPFSSYGKTNGESITLSGLAVTDIEIYKNGSTTQRASDNGYTLLDTDGIDFDGITGIHGFSVDLSDDTTAGFYSVGGQYFVVVSSVTVDGQTINFIAATFRIVAAENTAGYPIVDTAKIAGDTTSAGNLAKTTRVIGRGTASGTPTTTSIPTSAFTPNGAAADQFKGRIITFDADTATTALRGQSTDITASTNAAAPTFTVTALTTAPASGDTFSVT